MTRERSRAIEEAVDSTSARIFEIEGQVVRCYENDGHRLWRCDCADFRRRLTQLGEGFCGHTVVAIARCLEDGSINI